MSGDVLLNVILPNRRDHAGWLRVEVDGAPVGEFRVLGRGSATVRGRPTGNPTRNPFVHDGDTPTGDYDVPEILETARGEWDTHGPWGKLVLRPRAGDAIVAEWLGRDLLRIHGGLPGLPGQFDGYRSTRGCLRVSNTDMLTLRQLLFSAGEDSSRRMSHQIEVRLTVREF